VSPLANPLIPVVDPIAGHGPLSLIPLKARSTNRCDESRFRSLPSGEGMIRLADSPVDLVSWCWAKHGRTAGRERTDSMIAVAASKLSIADLNNLIRALEIDVVALREMIVLRSHRVEMQICRRRTA
jgi:hypothetical protein